MGILQIRAISLVLLAFGTACGVHAADLAAGTTAVSNGWRASLFVTRPEVQDDQLRGSNTVGARFSRRLSRDTRVSVDVFNVFDKKMDAIDPLAATRSLAHPAIGDNYLFHPAEQRGVRVGIKLTFK